MMKQASSKGASAPLATLLVFSPPALPQTQNICERLNTLSGPTCDFSNQNITSLNSGDFNGLSGLEQLFLQSQELSSLPEDVFAGLSSLETLRLIGRAYT